MSRFALVAILVACSSHESPSPAPGTTPVEVAKPPERPSLAGAEALAFLPASIDAVGVASSIDQLEAAISPPVLPIVEALTGLAPAGVSRTRPVGLATFRSGWVLFGYVEDAKALAASVPAARLAMRGQLAFIADAPETLARLLPQAGHGSAIQADKQFRKSVDALHRGALVSWWMVGWWGFRAAGVSVDGKTLRVHAVDGLPLPDDRRPRRGGPAYGVPKALEAKRREAYVELDAAMQELATARGKVLDDMRAQLGLAGGGPVEREVDVPAASVKAWAAPLVERWVATALVAKLRLVEQHVAAIDKEIQRIPHREIDSDADAARFADLLAAGPAGEISMSRASGQDLGQVLQRTSGNERDGGSAGLGPARVGAARIGTAPQPTVKLTGTGDVQLRAHLQARLDRVRTCYDHALERTADLRASVQVALDADSDGRVTAKTSGANAALAACIEVAVRGTSAGAKGVSASFTLELDPP